MRRGIQALDSAVKEALFPRDQCNAQTSRMFEGVACTLQCALKPGHDGPHWQPAGIYRNIGIYPAPPPWPRVPEQRWLETFPADKSEK